MEDKNAADRGIKSDVTLFSIIEHIRDQNGAGVTEISDHVGVSKSSVHGHLTTMREYGFVVKRDDTYHLGLEFFDYGQYVRNQFGVFRASQEAVDSLEEDTGEMSWLITHQDGKAMYIYGRGGENDIDVNAILGSWAYMHSNSGGKAILAHLSESEVDLIVDRHGLPAQTENTITDRETLDEELATIRDR
jgi:DNA-binding IclR family transcriptional regulator